MSFCPICGGEIYGTGTYCSASCRRTAARLRSDPIAAYRALLVKSRQRCRGCGRPIPERRLGALWCSPGCRGAYRGRERAEAGERSEAAS